MSESQQRPEKIFLESEEDSEVSRSNRYNTERDSVSDEEEELKQSIPSILPVLPVRDVVIFKGMVLPLFIGREKSVKAINAAMENKGRHILICTQREESIEDPEPSDLYQMGTVARILRMLKMPDGRIKLLVHGVIRAKIAEYERIDPYFEAIINLVEEIGYPADAASEALLRSVIEQSEKVLSLRGVVSPDILSVLHSVDDPGRLADLIAMNIRLKPQDAQKILEMEEPLKRLEIVNSHLQREVEVATVQAKIQSAARDGMEKAQKDYFLREQLKAIRNELGENDLTDEDIEELRQKIEKLGLPKEVKKEVDRQLRRLIAMHSDSSEANVVRTYLEWIIDLPWRKTTRDILDIAKAKEVLDTDHYGLEKVKDRILEFLSVRKLNPQSKGSILCFSGPPGVGKTSLGRSIAKALGRKFQRLSLGGMRDEAEIRGHRRTYIGSMPGRIIQVLKQAGTKNPVIVLDEVDKLGSDFRGDPSSALLEVLDPEQNNTFSDHYLNVPFDLSKILFLCTANHLDTIPVALRDRMEVITLPGYTMQEKTAIAKLHLVPKTIKENGLTEKDIEFDDKAIECVIKQYTREAGVRNLERELGSVCRKIARKKAEGSKEHFKVDAAMVGKLLGVPKYIEDERENELIPGMALGLAWTPAGGDVLTIEANVVKGKGKLLLTGQLGDVMKESAQAALSFVRTKADFLGLQQGFQEKNDIHIHVPDGATPKDGPSAGVTLTTALISALTGKKVSADYCMTGEITLRGRVLPVGGIKEKILAGVARDLSHVIIPFQNKKDLEDIPQNLLKKITVHPVHNYEEILDLVFEHSFTSAKTSGAKMDTDNDHNDQASKEQTKPSKTKKTTSKASPKEAN